ncbi:efflux RND transporter periplasmic adaptor subunit [Methylosinus sp. Sm6]|uniref:efflux RND transporter periplasmic adaptor subunit n=1 Tax=Methylosinus sp. Sm6 TaxID=2866948 RepID=UPI001C9A17EA|nr:efflux RND transporter periplasmic adaptor subunit [Methylosinus sp. Sm6]MBY6240083.1 efflux RND transporter periplasmic adaptor subunit [Methylosinus sp. Sm6]
MDIRSAIAIFTAAAALAGCDFQSSDRGEAPPARPEVGVVTLHPRNVAIASELPGRVVASLVAEVRPQVAGIIQQRLFQEGGEVAEGAPLYQIDPGPYRAAHDSAVAASQKAEASVPSARAKVERYQGLSKKNAVSTQDLETAVAALAQARADVATARANVASAKINLDHTTIKAPIGGRADKSSLTQGALVTAGQADTLTTIRTLDPIHVDLARSSAAMLDLRQAIDEGRIRLSERTVEVRLRLENGRVYPMTGRLEFTEAKVSQTTGTVTMRATFPNPSRLLLPGMYVRAIVEEGVAPGGFLVPQRAVVRNVKGEATALALGKDDKIEERVLTIVKAVGNNWLVTAGLGDGDRVVVEGLRLVRAGQQARGVEVVIDDATGELREREPTIAKIKAKG